FRERSLQADALRDVRLGPARTVKFPGRPPRMCEHMRRSDLEIVGQHVRAREVNALDDVEIAVVGYADGFADGAEGLRQDADGVDDKRVAVPAPDRMAVKTGIRIGRMWPAVGVDAPKPIAVRLAEHRDTPRREQDF